MFYIVVLLLLNYEEFSAFGSLFYIWFFIVFLVFERFLFRLKAFWFRFIKFLFTLTIYFLNFEVWSIKFWFKVFFDVWCDFESKSCNFNYEWSFILFWLLLFFFLAELKDLLFLNSDFLWDFGKESGAKMNSNFFLSMTNSLY